MQGPDEKLGVFGFSIGLFIVSNHKIKEGGTSKKSLGSLEVYRFWKWKFRRIKVWKYGNMTYRCVEEDGVGEDLESAR